MLLQVWINVSEKSYRCGFYNANFRDVELDEDRIIEYGKFRCQSSSARSTPALFVPVLQLVTSIGIGNAKKRAHYCVHEVYTYKPILCVITNADVRGITN